MNTVLSGATVVLSLRVVDDNTPANNPVVGLTTNVAIRRTSDDKWYDFVATTWDTIASYALLEASNKQALADKTDGSYSVAWDQAAADASTERNYEMTYAVTAGAGYVGRQAGEEWRFTEDVPTAATIADAVLDELLAGHTGAGSLGAAFDTATADSLAWRLARLFHRFLTKATLTEDVDGNAVLVVKDAAAGNTVRTVDLTKSGLVTDLEVQ